MAQKRKYETARDPRRQFPKLREDLRKRVYAMQDHCGICGREVDKTLKAGNDLSPELDEIIPIKLGGSAYDIDNLQLTHRVCNRRKGAKLASEGIDKDLNPTPTSRDWSLPL